MEKSNENHTNDPDSRKDFFISYAIEDRKVATWIHQQLEADGYHTIFPGRDFKARNHFIVEMRNALPERIQRKTG